MLIDEIKMLESNRDVADLFLSIKRYYNRNPKKRKYPFLIMILFTAIYVSPYMELLGDKNILITLNKLLGLDFVFTGPMLMSFFVFFARSILTDKRNNSLYKSLEGINYMFVFITLTQLGGLEGLFMFISLLIVLAIAIVVIGKISRLLIEKNEDFNEEKALKFRVTSFLIVMAITILFMSSLGKDGFDFLIMRPAVSAIIILAYFYTIRVAETELLEYYNSDKLKLMKRFNMSSKKALQYLILAILILNLVGRLLLLILI